MNKLTQPAVILRIAIAFAYIVLGVIALITKFSKVLLTPTTKIPFALLLIAYGLFRLYRVYRMVYIDDED